MKAVAACHQPSMSGRHDRKARSCDVRHQRLRCYDVLVRTTIRVDDDLLERLRAQARKEKVSLTRVLNRTLKAGLRAGGARRGTPSVYREQSHAMGAPRLVLDKALALAARLEDEETARELTLRK